MIRIEEIENDKILVSIKEEGKCLDLENLLKIIKSKNLDDF